MSEKPRDVAAEETTRQLIILTFSLAGTFLTLILVRELADPDRIRTWKMRLALAVKRRAQRQVDMWQRIADSAATIYNQEKM